MKKLKPYSFGKEVGVVGFFGIGKSSLALLELMPSDVKIVLRSEGKIKRELLPKGIPIIKIFEGEDAFSDICEDILFLSPSVRRDRAELLSAKERGVILSSDFELFLKENDKPLFAVSGSDGKSTTVTMLAELLSEKYGDVEPIGNVGVPFCTALNNSASAHVAEISSFQLQYSSPASYRAALTSITPNHLNWHSSFEEYAKTKLKLLEHSECPVVSLDRGILEGYARSHETFALIDSERTYRELQRDFNSKVYFTLESGQILRNGEPVISTEQILRREEYNIKNLMTAVALADGLATRERIARLASTFTGLAHRCELFLEAGGVKYIDSSIDTSPARTVKTLSALGEGLIVILGGLGKGTSYDVLREPLRRHAREVVITGKNRYEIAASLGCDASIHTEGDFENAVRLAITLAAPSDTVILSPASTSFDAFESYEKRGEFFKKIVKNYYKT
ncbi:MAG: UDP-N-acetylmuramoyl-L-alanine--D-glutamate ligase [Clostridia bacterium]|nr:UDP-N-acetylmuramoyl-L-alanine--D-glutamate ligase [Clostridia bacterium]